MDGVEFEVLYPSMALPMFGIPDSDLQYAVFGAYNDWIAEFAAFDPSRMLGIGMVCLDTSIEPLPNLSASPSSVCAAR